MTIRYDACTSCGSPRLTHFYEVGDVPTNSVLLCDTREAALAIPRGDVRLARCEDCAFIFNAAFDPSLTEYSGRYESTQAFSATFQRFNESLADDLVHRFGLRGKRLAEIGCGDGDFLRLLCERGGNQGVGIDPAYDTARHRHAEGLEFRPEFFTRSTDLSWAEGIVCKMTLEHIIDVGRFVGDVRASMGTSTPVTFFQVPNARYVFGGMAFWDVYYEHCSYFSAGSLDRLFARSGFEVLDTWPGYDDQYLMIACKPGTSGHGREPSETVAEVVCESALFASTVGRQMASWTERVARFNASNEVVAAWGAGSKAVAFLAALGDEARVDVTVDINPVKAGTYLPGSGHEIVSPAALVDRNPGAVIVMNPVYLDEITRDLHALGLCPEVLAL